MTYKPNEKITHLRITRDEDFNEHAESIWQVVEQTGEEISEQLRDLDEYFIELGEDTPPSLERIAHLVELIHSQSTAYGQAKVYAQANHSLPKSVAFDIMQAMAAGEKWRPSVGGVVINYTLYICATLAALALYHVLTGG